LLVARIQSVPQPVRLLIRVPSVHTSAPFITA
jgi:hypothetical protein